MKKKLIIYGIGSYAEYAAYAFDNDTQFEVACFCISKEYKTQDVIFGKPLISLEQAIENYKPEFYYMFVAIGNNAVRTRIYKDLKKTYNFASYISSQARKSSNLLVGSNSFIDEACALQPFVQIENNCILFAAELGHHTIVRSHCLVSGTITGGNVIISEYSYLGMKSAIKQNVRIGKHTVIGMGCNIESDTQPYEVFSQKGTVKRVVTSDRLRNLFLD